MKVNVVLQPIYKMYKMAEVLTLLKKFMICYHII